MRWLATDALVPNAYNPNVQDAGQFKELVAEVRHLGRMPKPIVVRPRGDGWQIVDGEHTWRAAQAVGLPWVLCEVVDDDDFEAMRQTYKRNQHGRHDPVALGRMFGLMIQARGCSRRALAATIGVSEATVRNAMLYTEAAALRNADAAGAPTTRLAISDLTVQQVRIFVSLPHPVRSVWLESGADRRAAANATVLRLTDILGGVLELDLKDAEEECWDALVSSGLAVALRVGAFVESAHEAFRLLLLRRKYLALVPTVDAYLQPLAEFHLPASLFDALTWCSLDGEYSPRIHPAMWRDILALHAADSRLSHTAMKEQVSASVAKALSELSAGHLPSAEPTTEEALNALATTPLFIQRAVLPLADKLELARLIADSPATMDLTYHIGERACACLAQMRLVASSPAATRATRRRFATATAKGAFDHASMAVCRERDLAEYHASCTDHAALAAAVGQLIGNRAGLPTGRVAPSIATMVERLLAVPLPELRLLGGLLLGVDDAVDAWCSTLLVDLAPTGTGHDASAL